MVNHYASLLLNLSGENEVNENKSYFTDHSYSQLELPSALKEFYNLLFPVGSSFYYRQFLCYCFLRVLHSANMQNEIIKYDKRVSYDLDLLKEYFRLKRSSVPTTSNPSFTLTLLGEYTVTGANNYYFNSYTIAQNGALPEVYVYSDVDKLFLKKDKVSPVKSDEMRIPLIPTSSLSIGGNFYAGGDYIPYRMTKAVPIGTTGLSFVLLGNFDDNVFPGGKFTDTPDKYWNFIVESPFIFEFMDFFNKLVMRDTVVARMINYGESNVTNLNIFNNHYNEAYRFSGLLNLYIEKVNAIWVRNQM
jgi:hypothetical protein